MARHVYSTISNWACWNGRVPVCVCVCVCACGHTHVHIWARDAEKMIPLMCWGNLMGEEGMKLEKVRSQILDGLI